MRSPRFHTALLAGAALLIAAPALAIAPAPSRDDAQRTLPSFARPSDPARRAALDAAPAWRAFRAEHDGWRVMWNEATGTPHRAFGRGIALSGFRADADGVDQAVRGFVGGHPGLFAGRPVLERVRVHEVEGLWYARYRQIVNGLPVLFADWEFRVSRDGRLVAFGADALDAAVAGTRTPHIPAVVAREAARAGVAFDPATDRAEVREALWMLPVREGGAMVLRPVYEVRLSVAAPRAEWITLVDAADGTVRWRHDRVRHVISGTVNGAVHPTRASEPTTVLPFADLRVTVGGAQVFTNAAGFYSSPAAGVTTVSAGLFGRWVDVNRQDAADAVFSTSVADPATVNIGWAGAHEAERDGFYHTGRIHDYVKSIIPAFTGNDYVMPCAVNINSTCNAFWDGTGINFYLAGGGCPNTATMPDVVYHEYGHGVNDNLYLGEGAPFGMINGALHEGTADVLASMAQDDFRIGKDFFGPGTVLRSVDNTNHWPQDDGEGHFAGLTIGGAFWDLRQAAGLAVTERLHLLAKYGLPDDFDNGTAMAEYFVEVLIADDDDANLANGTPHGNDIIAAFNAHGIGTGFYVNISHVVLGDQAGNGPYPVTATITFSGPIGALDTASPTLWFSVNGTPFQSTPMTPAGGNQYIANLPQTSYGFVRYYITAEDQLGFGRAFPLLAPADVVTFLAGPTITAFTHNQEADQGWTVGAAGDNALTGVWLRADPVGTDVGGGVLAQPEDDHTVAGVNCFVTGNAPPGSGAGTNDVDGGRTTLLTPVFSAAGLHLPLIEYWRWYSNDLGSAPGEDFWRVDISNDGGATWTPVENTNAADNSWRRALFFIDDAVVPTATMRLRFIAEDAVNGSLVEAAVDDLRLLSYPAQVSVPGPEAAALALARPAPNPFGGETRIAYVLPAAGDVALRIVDVQGRAVRTLARGDEAAGPHVATWDGRDDGGRPVAAGAYWVRLSAAGREVTRRVVRLP